MLAPQILNRAAAVFAALFSLTVAACSGAGSGDQDIAGLEVGQASASGTTSDDFHTGVLDTGLWNVVDPRGDGTVELVGAGTPDAHLLLSVPSGTSHDAWGNNTTLRVMQPAADEDFEIEVKFESIPGQRYQIQGLLVEEDPSNYLRLDVHHDGSSFRVFSATFSDLSPRIRTNSSIASGQAVYLRLARNGDQWTGSYSTDGSSWSTVASFSHALTVSSVGVFAGNYNPNPAYTAVVDYFFETSAPIAQEDPPPCDPADVLVLTTQATNGTILRDPDQGSYSCGDVVTLTAQPDVGATFLGWGGALSGTTNPTSVTMNADTSVTANFDLDVSPPQVGAVNVTPSETSAVVSWQTDELSTGFVEYGETTSYELGAVASSTLSTAHAVTLPGLIEGTDYHYRITAEDSFGNAATGADATFTTTSTGGGTGGTGGGTGGTGGGTGGTGGGTGGTAGTGGTGGGSGGVGGSGAGGGSTPPGAILSDDFYAEVLDTELWQVVDPQGDGMVDVVGAGTPDAHLRLSVPSGTEHDPWKSNNTSLRVMQPAVDANFAIEAMFVSVPTERYQIQGLLVEEDADDYLRFDFHHDGSSLKVFSATFINGAHSIRVNDVVAPTTAVYMRLTRNDDLWTAEHSDDGLSWTTATSFSHPMTVRSVGLFAGNAGPNPANTVLVDYFFDVASPIVPEDARCDTGEQFVLSVTSNGPGIVTQDPDQSTYGCGDLVTLTAQPDAGVRFTGWGGALSGAENPTTVTVNADTTVTASFDLDETAPQVTGVDVFPSETSADIVVQTDELSIISVEYGETTAYGGAVDSTEFAIAHTITLPGLNAGTLYHYRVITEDVFGNRATGADATFTAAALGPEIDVWYGPYQSFGEAGVPQRFINILGNASDSDGITSLTYSLGGGPELPLSMGPNGTRLVRSGDFNIEIAYADLPAGVSDVTVRATDTRDNVTLTVVQVEKLDGGVTPLPYSIDWSAVTEVSEVAQIVDGKWALGSDGLRVLEPGYDRIVAIGDLDWVNYEATVEITLHAFVPNPRWEPIIGLGMRWTGHFDWDGSQPRVGWYPLGSLMAYFHFRPDGGWTGLNAWTSDGTQVTGDSVSPPAVGVPYTYKMRGETTANGNVEYKMKMWRSGEPEPSGWGIILEEDQAPPSGSLLVVVHEAEVTVGNVLVQPVAD